MFCELGDKGVEDVDQIIRPQRSLLLALIGVRGDDVNDVPPKA